jgi:hypothetical protein
MKKKPLVQTHLGLIFAIMLITVPVLAQKAAPPFASPAWPGMKEAFNIAEEGFIYGLPIVMNYAVMYEYCVDRNSGQYKAPFNQIYNEARVFTYKDTAIVTPNSDTPYSLLWLDLRAEPFVLSVPAVEKERYYAVMLCDGNVFNYGYIGSRHWERGQRLSGGWPPLERENPCRYQKGVPFLHAIFLSGLPDPAFKPERHAQRSESPVRLQSTTAFLLSTRARTSRRSGNQIPKGQQGVGKEEFF